MDNIEQLAVQLTTDYQLTYRSRVNLEAALRNAVQDGLSVDDAEKFVRDIIENVESIDTK